jgi:hypothetical protein
MALELTAWGRLLRSIPCASQEGASSLGAATQLAVRSPEADCRVGDESSWASTSQNKNEDRQEAYGQVWQHSLTRSLW